MRAPGRAHGIAEGGGPAAAPGRSGTHMRRGGLHSPRMALTAHGRTSVETHEGSSEIQRLAVARTLE
jgi:hypothetical protein